MLGEYCKKIVKKWILCRYDVGKMSGANIHQSMFYRPLNILLQYSKVSETYLGNNITPLVRSRKIM